MLLKMKQLPICNNYTFSTRGKSKNLPINININLAMLSATFQYVVSVDQVSERAWLPWAYNQAMMSRLRTEMKL